jgi:hypothetical protein
MAQNWRLAVCTRWRPLVGTALGIALLVAVGFTLWYLQLDKYLYSSFAQFEEVGPWVRLGLTVVLPIGLPLVGLRLWCKRQKRRQMGLQK